MANEFLAALFIIGIGISVSGAATYLFQWLSKQEAKFRFDGETLLSGLGNVMLSVVCGPFIMLNMGWRRDSAGGLHLSQALLSAFVAFGWSFIVGLISLGTFVAFLNG